MAESEFELIRRYFATATPSRSDVILGIGDDCALLTPPAGECLAVSIDTLVEGRHFAIGADPEALGHKSLAVNLSDLAAMGARPAWATLALTLPAADHAWLDAFVRGFTALANRFQLQLVGGDTTRGPLSVTIQVHGFVQSGLALKRSGAAGDDRLFVSGPLGDAALALRQRLAGAHDVAQALADRLDRPQPRIELGLVLRHYAGAAIDISDGLLGDLAHMCDASGVGARLDLAAIPRSDAVRRDCDRGNWSAVLAGGDDYELLFTVRASSVPAMRQACVDGGHQVYEIGVITAQAGIALHYPDGSMSTEIPHGFDHFRS